MLAFPSRFPHSWAPHPQFDRSLTRAQTHARSFQLLSIIQNTVTFSDINHCCSASPTALIESLFTTWSPTVLKLTEWINEGWNFTYLAFKMHFYKISDSKQAYFLFEMERGQMEGKRRNYIDEQLLQVKAHKWLKTAILFWNDFPFYFKVCTLLSKQQGLIRSSITQILFLSSSLVLVSGINNYFNSSL